MTESRSASQDDSMMFSDTPMVVQVVSPSVESMSTLVTASVPRSASSTRTL